MSRRLKTEALVLKRKELLDRDIVYTLLTSELGKVKTMAKGIKSITSKRSPHLQTGNLIDVLLYKKNDFFYIQETQLKSAFSEVKKTGKKMSHLYFILFVLDRLLPENQKEEGVYNLLKKFLIKLSKVKNVDLRILEKYLSLILIDLGYISEEKDLEELQAVIQDLINEKLSFHII